MELKDLLELYLKRGFGSMNKNDFEVFLFGKIIEFPNYKGKNNYDLSLALKIPETKIKRLRYESALRNNNYDEEHYKDSVRELLKNSQLRGEDNKILFQVEDVMLKLYISSILKKEGRMIDHSFNDEVLVIRIEDYEHLLKAVYDEITVNQELKKAQKTFGKEITWAKILEWTIQGMASGLISAASSNMVNLSLQGIKAIIPLLTQFAK